LYYFHVTQTLFYCDFLGRKQKLTDAMKKNDISRRDIMDHPLLQSSTNESTRFAEKERNANSKCVSITHLLIPDQIS